MKKLLSIVLACAMICSIFVMPVSVSAAAGDKVFFPIDEAHGANSKLYVEYNSTEYQNLPTATSGWAPGLDFASCLTKISGTKYTAPTGVFATDKANLYSGRALAFVLGKTATFTTKDGKTVWTINNVDYEVYPNEKTISVMNYVGDASAVEDTALREDYASMAGLTFEVENGHYDEIGFLAAAFSGSTHWLKITPIYTDDNGVADSENMLSATAYSNSTYPADAKKVYLKNFLGSNWNNVTSVYIAHTFDIDETRELDKVLIQSNNGAYPISVISSWGISAEQAAEPVFEVTDAKVEGSSVKVAYTNTTAADKAVKVIVAEYNDAAESSLADVHIIDATLTVGGAEFTQSVATTKSTVKVFVWKDLTDFFPYK